MSKVVLAFLDRLAERFAALMAGLVSSRVEGLHAAAQAEQQSELEELARHYEADGKPAIAQTLRQRAARLTSVNLASEAVELMQQLAAHDPPALPTGSVGAHGELRGLPNFESSKVPKKRRSTETNDSAFPTLEGQS
jgi:hypothetical protein